MVFLGPYLRKIGYIKLFFKKPSYRNETMYKKYKNKLNHVIKSAKKIIEEKNVRKKLLPIFEVQKRYENDMAKYQQSSK